MGRIIMEIKCSGCESECHLNLFEQILWSKDIEESQSDAIKAKLDYMKSCPRANKKRKEKK